MSLRVISLMAGLSVLVAACHQEPASNVGAEAGNSPTPTDVKSEKVNITPPTTFAGVRERGETSLTGALSALEVLSLPKAFWGADVKATAKGLLFVHDNKTGRIFSTGHTNPSILVTDMGQSHPSASLEVEFKNHDVPILAIDEARRNLFYIVASSGSVWVYDVDTLKLKASQSYPPPRGNDPYPIRDVAVDPGTGWLWMVNFAEGKLIGHSPDLTQEDAVAVSLPLTMVAAGPDQLVLTVGHDSLMPGHAGGKPGGPPAGGPPRGGPPAGARPHKEQRPGAPGGAPAGMQTGKSGRPEVVRGSASAAAQTLPPTDLMLFNPSTRAVSSKVKLESFISAGTPNRMLVGSDKTVYAAVNHEVIAFSLDGDFKWRTSIKGQAERFALVGNKLGVVDHAGAADNALVVLDASTGEKLSSLKARYSNCEISGDTRNNQFLLSNTDDGSIWVVGLDGKMVREINAGLTAEKLVYDPKTGTRYILDRLGGSRILVWKEGASTVQEWDGGVWPSDLIVDPKRRWLMALGHFEGTIYRWDIDTEKQLPSVSLQVPQNTQDTLGDFAYDSQTTTLVATFPESRTVTALDMESGKRLWSQKLEGIGSDTSGPEFSAVALDPERKKIYVWSLLKKTIYVLSLKDGSLQNTIEISIQQDTEGSGMAAQSVSAYQGGILFLDRDNDRLFVGRYAIDLKEEKLIGRTPIEKAFYGGKDMVLGFRKQDAKTDVLVQLDPKTLTEITAVPLAKVQYVGMQGTYDAERKRLYAIEMDRALVHMYQWPQAPK